MSFEAKSFYTRRPNRR